MIQCIYSRVQYDDEMWWFMETFLGLMTTMLNLKIQLEEHFLDQVENNQNSDQTIVGTIHQWREDQLL